jgi:hypothetical protein
MFPEYQALVPYQYSTKKEVQFLCQNESIMAFNKIWSAVKKLFTKRFENIIQNDLTNQSCDICLDS